MEIVSFVTCGIEKSVYASILLTTLVVCWAHCWNCSVPQTHTDMIQPHLSQLQLMPAPVHILNTSCTRQTVTKRILKMLFEGFWLPSICSYTRVPRGWQLVDYLVLIFCCVLIGRLLMSFLFLPLWIGRFLFIYLKKNVTQVELTKQVK